MSDLKDFDSFWLGKGQTLINSTITNLTTHIKNSVAYLNALSGFYLVAGTTAEILYKSSCIWIYLCYMLPVIFVQFLKFKVTAGQKVLTNQFDLRNPLQIKDTHNEMVRELISEVNKGKRKLFYATAAVVVGFSIAIFLNNLESKKEEENKRNNAVEKLKKAEKKLLETDSKLSSLKSIVDQKQKFKVTQSDETLKIEAFLLEDRTLNISYPNKENSIQQELTTFIIHKNQEYLLDLKGKNYQLTKVWLTEK